jgi:hypothetical protein
VKKLRPLPPPPPPIPDDLERQIRELEARVRAFMAQAPGTMAAAWAEPILGRTDLLRLKVHDDLAALQRDCARVDEVARMEAEGTFFRPR